MPAPIGWTPSPSKVRVGWSSLKACSGVPQPITIDDLVLPDIMVFNEYPGWTVDDWYGPVIHDGTHDESPQ